MNAAMEAAAQLAAARSVVIKVGSALLVSSSHELRRRWLDRLSADIATLIGRGQRVTIVSSGAVALGRSVVSRERNSLDLATKQAAAAVGQVTLAQAWREALAANGVAMAQILLTPQDTEDRRRHLNARATLAALHQSGVVAVINENDTVATDELRYGDNDRLAARVAQMIGADVLLLLSDVDGLYDADPAMSNEAEHIPFVERLDDDLRAMAGDSSQPFGTGGMRSKLLAVDIAAAAGAAVVVASGRDDAPIAALGAGARATVFAPARSVPDARRRWIRASLRRQANVQIDAGALKALRGGASLLPVGVNAVQGEFERGDCVAVTHDDDEVGIGLAAMDSRSAREAIDRANAGDRTAPLIHTDNLVLHVY